ncbi:putative membrane protein [Cavenderia fasciculata]|uniref:Membrane protein n=1 Tax=Cavenderia fasciculata TaxID=261658 RepID=F4PL64_CACFS|nr:uncharacterized protein DFA_05418 [Cavenderia fasciculata]EGG23286.1 putative membrane protein [Cavenderia fasciculata]|eukprot:XP_004361137.1 putative membrane protein [Cavenderia fasciculata]
MSVCLSPALDLRTTTHPRRCEPTTNPSSKKAIYLKLNNYYPKFINNNNNILKMNDRSKVGLVLSILCILVGLLIIGCGIYVFVDRAWYDIKGFVIACIFLLFGVFIVILEFVFPAKMVYLFGFYTFWAGKGLFFCILGLLILGNHGFFLFAGIVTIAVGIILTVVHFIGAVGCPRPLISGDGSIKSTKSTTTTTTTTTHNNV